MAIWNGRGRWQPASCNLVNLTIQVHPTVQPEQVQASTFHLLERWSHTRLTWDTLCPSSCFNICSRGNHQDRDITLSFCHHWARLSYSRTSADSRTLSRRQQVQLLLTQLSLPMEEGGFGIPQAEDRLSFHPPQFSGRQHLYCDILEEPEPVIITWSNDLGFWLWEKGSQKNSSLHSQVLASALVL